MLFTKGSLQCGPFAPNFTKDMKRNFLGMLVILMSMATIRVSAQAFKFSGDTCREHEDGDNDGTEVLIKSL